MTTYTLSDSGQMQIILTLSPGWCWQVAVVAEDKTVDFDLYVSDSSGQEISKDNSSNADAYCTFDAVGDGKYTLLVKSKKGSGQYSLDINPVGPIQKETQEEAQKSKTTLSGRGSSGTTIKEILKEGLSDQEKIEILQAHNNWRAKYGVQPMEWSETLTQKAQAWAKELANRGFKLEHSPAPPRIYGENIAYGGNTNLSSPELDLTAQRVVDLWGNEVNDYDYETNTCAPGKVCGHYTQVVWKNSQRVGGGTLKGIIEDTNGNRSVQEIWVCQYDPPGNFVGQKPY